MLLRARLGRRDGPAAASLPPGGAALRPPLERAWFRLGALLGAALALLALLAVWDALLAWSALGSSEALARHAPGAVAEARALDRVQARLLTAETLLLLPVAWAGTHWLVTAHRCNRLLRFLTRHDPRWASAGLAVPGLNLVRPVQLLADVRRAGTGDPAYADWPLLVGWWAVLCTWGAVRVVTLAWVLRAETLHPGSVLVADHRLDLLRLADALLLAPAALAGAGLVLGTTRLLRDVVGGRHDDGRWRTG